MALDVTALAESGAGQNSGQLLQSPLTEAGAILGTPAYMSPEQHDGQPTDARSDQFSFCAALYEALYHQRPFPGETLLALSFNVLQGRLRPPPAQTAVPARIERALRRGLSLDPAARFPSMRELLHELDIDPQRDPAGAPLARRLFSLVCVGTLWINTAMTSAARMNGTLTVRNLLWADLAMLLIALSVIKWQRKTLMTNAFHRGLVSIVLVTLTQTVLVRAASEYLGFSVEQVLTLDMFLLSGMFALIALFYLRGAWALMAISLVASLAHLLPPKLELALISTAYPTLSLGLVWLWDRAAGGLQRCAPTSKSAT